MGNNVTFSTPTPMSAIVGSHDRSAYPIIRNNLSLGTPGRSVRNASTSSSIFFNTGYPESPKLKLKTQIGPCSLGISKRIVSKGGKKRLTQMWRI